MKKIWRVHSSMTCEFMRLFASTLLIFSFAYNPAGNGRWVSLNLKRKKKAGGRRRKKIEVKEESPDDDNEEEVDGEDVEMEGTPVHEEDDGQQNEEAAQPVAEEEDDANDPAKTVPLTRYNAMLAIVKNTLFM